MHIPSHPVHTAAHCNPLQPAATYPVHIQCTHCSSHYIFSAHCSYTIQCTLQLYHPVHTAAMYSHVQLSAANLQCTLQPSTTIYTAAILSSTHCSYTIWFQSYTSSAPLNHHRVSLYHYWHTSRAVSRH